VWAKVTGSQRRCLRNRPRRTFAYDTDADYPSGSLRAYSRPQPAIKPEAERQANILQNCQRIRWYLPRPLVPAAARSAWALEHKPATADKPESTALRCHKASYGPAPDPVFLAADGVTWRAVWEPQAEAPAGKANGAGRVAAVGDPSLEQLPE
jgi:hypothetical protein